MIGANGDAEPNTVARRATPALPVVLQVLPSLEAGGGGVERATIDIAEAVAAAGRTTLVASAGGSLVRELERKGALHLPLPLDRKNPLSIRANIDRLATAIEAYNVDIVHARSRAPAWSALLAARRTRRAFLTTFHGAYNFGRGIPGMAKRYYNSVMSRGDLVIANSNFIAAHVGHIYGVGRDQVRVIPRGVDLQLFDPDNVTPARVIDLAARWRLPDGPSIVMLPGRLTRWKGHGLLLDALAALDPTHQVHCVMVGAEQGREEYRRALERRVERLGLAGRVQIVGHCDDMPAAYMLADVVVSASTDPEAFGRVVAEAQALGRPVVVAGHGGAAEQIRDGETGWTFKPGDAGALARALDHALSLDEAARRGFAAAAIEHAREHYSKAEMVAATLDVYRELYAARRALQPAAA